MASGLKYAYVTYSLTRLCELSYLAVDFIVYRSTLMTTNENGQNFISDYFLVSDFLQANVNHPVSGPNPMVSALLFYGLYHLGKTTAGFHTPFDINLDVSGNDLAAQVGNAHVIHVYLMYFVTIVNCPVGKYFNATDYACYLCTNLFVGCNTCTDTACGGCTSPY